MTPSQAAALGDHLQRVGDSLPVNLTWQQRLAVLIHEANHFMLSTFSQPKLLFYVVNPKDPTRC